MFRIFNLLIALFFIFCTGCTTTRQQDSEIAKWMLPVNIAGSYFASVALHEAGHAFPAMALGADSVRVDVLPTRDREGHFHLGLTTYRAPAGHFSDTDFTIINTMGPTAQFVGHVGMRELLKTNRIPRLLQPTMGWFGLFNQIGFYFHAINGLARNRRTDLGKEEAWIAGTMLAGGLLYDIYDFLTAEKAENRFLVLFGEHFYEPKEERRVKLLSAPTRGGAFLGFEFNF